MAEATDWDAYYRRSAGIAQLTRKLTTSKIVTLLEKFSGKPTTVCEFGGANSCVLSALCDSQSFAEYHVIDSNPYGLSLLPDSCRGTNITSQLQDILSVKATGDTLYDVVLSIGLIEHFDEAGTRSAINAHVDTCKPGGTILITFPTPTFLYRTVRSIAEVLGVWKFPDERPLLFDEVIPTLNARCHILHQSINWPIILTQGVVVARKKMAAG